MNTFKSRLLALVTALALASTSLIGIAPANAVNNPEGGNKGQSDVDGTYSSGDGGWGDTSIGLTGRPFITSLKVNDTEQLSSTPTDSTQNKMQASNMQAVVYPTNACNSSQTPTPGVCYNPPNRVEVTLGYLVSGQFRTNLSFSPSPLDKGITSTTPIELTINMNGLSPKLGWTWLNGKPEYWKVSSSGGVTTLQVKFYPRDMPSTSGMDNTFCTAIPVSTCEKEQSELEMLTAKLIISVDDTASLFAGTLFASESAVIGSLEANLAGADSVSTNALTYGIAAPHKLPDGTIRTGKFYGLVPNSLLTTSFGLTDPTQASSLMSIARTTASSGGTDTISWAPWTAATNGTDGQLVTISDITFSAPKFAMKSKMMSKGKKRTKSQLLADLGVTLAKGEKVSFKVAKASKKICKVSGSSIKAVKAGTCTYSATVKKKGKKVAVKSKTGAFGVR